MNTAIPEIPETATEEYLEKLAEKIYTRLEATDNEKVKERLRTLLETVERRKQQLFQQTRTLGSEAPDTLTRAPLDILETTELSPEQQDEIKARLENVLSDIKKQRSHAPQETLTRSFSQTDDESSSQTFIEAGQLTEQEYDIVKQRMAEMLADVREQQPTAQESAEEEDILELGQELEIGEDEEPPDGEELLDLGPEQEIEAFLDAQELETLAFPTERDLPISQSEQQEKYTESVSEDEIDLDADDKLSFKAACRRVGKGEALILFEKINISEREQLMVEAFKEHLTQMKGLKRQQVFEMQHLTSRSIRELELIFKTYRLQGYLRAELNNIYNRLLNLRSRFSILQH